MKVRIEFGIALLSGVVAGAVGFAAFLLMHAISIGPIKSIAHVVVWAVLAGIMVGWAYDVHRVRLPERPVRRVALVFACASLVMAPGLLQLLTPLSPGGSPPSNIFVLVVGGFEGLVLAATPVIAAAVGALLGRSVRAAVATALAAFMFLIVIAHNFPFGFSWRAVTMWTITLTVTAIASITLVAVDFWVSRAVLRTPPMSEATTTSGG